MSLYERLQVAPQAERRRVAAELIRGMQTGDTDANQAYYELCERVIADEQAQETIADEQLPRWEFPPGNSALLVRAQERVQGFLTAIARAPQAKSIIDAGCGSSALLAVGAAIDHPQAEVIAYEINPKAARCASAVIALMGLSDRVRVETADIFETNLPQVDLAFTETFAPALTVEPGPGLTAVLARVAREILPHRVRLFACDQPISPNTVWQPAATVELREPRDYIGGQLVSTGAGPRTIYVHANYYDARDDPVLLRQHPDSFARSLTNPVRLGTIRVQQAGTPIVFRYEAGAELHISPAGLAIGHAAVAA